MEHQHRHQSDSSARSLASLYRAVQAINQASSLIRGKYRRMEKRREGISRVSPPHEIIECEKNADLLRYLFLAPDAGDLFFHGIGGLRNSEQMGIWTGFWWWDMKSRKRHAWTYLHDLRIIAWTHQYCKKFKFTSSALPLLEEFSGNPSSTRDQALGGVVTGGASVTWFMPEYVTNVR